MPRYVCPSDPSGANYAARYGGFYRARDTCVYGYEVAWQLDQQATNPNWDVPDAGPSGGYVVVGVIYVNADMYAIGYGTTSVYAPPHP